MSGRIICIFSIGSLLVLGHPCTASGAYHTDDANENCAGQIYLLREVTVDVNCLLLGQVGIIRGSDDFVARASRIPLGRISVPGQEIIIDRPMVLSRLACNGIPSSKVALLGAEKVKVKQKQQTIKGDDFVKKATAFLKDNPQTLSICRLETLSMPQDFGLPGADRDIELRPRLAQTSAGSQVKVEIAVFQEGKRIGLREVSFRVKYNCRRAVTVVDVPAGSLISSENVKIENIISSQPEMTDWKPPYGLVAKRHLLANTVLAENMVGPVNPPVVVERNRSVVIRLEKPGFLVTAVGKALENGRAGEQIKVRNVDSQRIILARVNEDGTVEPVL